MNLNEDIFTVNKNKLGFILNKTFHKKYLNNWILIGTCMYTMWDLYTIIIVLRQKITNKVTYKISLCSVFNMFNNCSSFNLYKAKIIFPLHEIDVNNWSLSAMIQYCYRLENLNTVSIVLHNEGKILVLLFWKVKQDDELKWRYIYS
jgi:hypothetical protein